jgi:hypothetical protein
MWWRFKTPELEFFSAHWFFRYTGMDVTLAEKAAEPGWPADPVPVPSCFRRTKITLLT